MTAATHRAQVVVTGATGKTGMEVVSHLVRGGVPTLALGHREDARTEHLRSIGAQVVCGDFDDPTSWAGALRGAQAVYLCLPPDRELLARTASFIDMAKQERLRRVVNMSQFHVREEHPSPLTRQHWLAERLLDQADVGAVHLRATFFGEGYLILGAPVIHAATPLCLPFGNERVAPVACTDIGRVASVILSAPDRAWDSTYSVTGPMLLDHQDIARAFSTVLGRRVDYVDIPVERWCAGATEAGLPPFLVEHFARTAEDFTRGAFARVTDIVETIGGAAATGFEQILEHALSRRETPAAARA